MVKKVQIVFCYWNIENILSDKIQKLQNRAANFFFNFRMANAVSALPFTTEFPVKPGRAGYITEWVFTWVWTHFDPEKTWYSCE